MRCQAGACGVSGSIVAGDTSTWTGPAHGGKTTIEPAGPWSRVFVAMRLRGVPFKRFRDAQRHCTLV